MHLSNIFSLFAISVTLVQGKLQISGSDICLSGCCGFSLDVSNANLISNDTTSRLPISKTSIPCCACDKVKTAHLASVKDVLSSDDAFVNIGAMPQKPLINLNEREEIAQPDEPASVPVTEAVADDLTTQTEDDVTASAAGASSSTTIRLRMEGSTFCIVDPRKCCGGEFAKRLMLKTLSSQHINVDCCRCE